MIDPAVLKLFSKKFLEIEMLRHGIQSVKESLFFCEMKGQAMVALPQEKTIYIDTSTDWEAARRKLNWPGGNVLSYDSRSYALPVVLKDEMEAKLFIFWHECKHIEDKNAEEYVCDSYARTRVLQWREGK